ncbi:MAG: methyl-accepting chemotaxis protein [Anaerovoracaceae bacterium]|jgi:methyl-accepting chemotaxis protein
MKISTRIVLFATIMMAVSVSIIATLGIVENTRYNERIGYERAASSTGDLQRRIQEAQLQSEKNGIAIAQNFQVVRAVENGDFNQMKRALDDLNQILNADTISLTDAEGNILIRQHEPDKKGDNILNQSNVQKALKGETATTLEPGALVKLSCRTGTPIYNEKRQIIGCIVTGFTFENTPIIDELKELHNTELTIFGGNERIATTIIQNGERVVGTPLDEHIEQVVLGEGKEYIGKANILGEPYLTRYEPLKNTKGEVVGAVFSGMSEAEAAKATRKAIFIMVLAAAIIIVLCSVILINFVNRSIRVPMEKLTNASKMLADGRLDVDVDRGSRSNNDEVAALSNAMHQMVVNLQEYILDISRVLSQMAEKNFTARSDARYKGDFMPIKQALEGITASLNNTFANVNSAVFQFNSTAKQIADSSQILAHGASVQADSIEQLTKSILNISDDIKNNTKNVGMAVDYANQAVSGAKDGNRQMKQMLNAMNDIKNASDQIKKVISAIDDIAFQTNILSLNAAVEAARAGSAGKGFSVVAEEVRNLSIRSAEAVKQSAILINNSIQAVNEGYKIADGTAEVIQDVETRIEHVKGALLDIERSSSFQAEEIEQITSGLDRISQVVHTNSSTSQQNAAASQEFSSQAALLYEEVSQFRIEDSKELLP